MKYALPVLLAAVIAAATPALADRDHGRGGGGWHGGGGGEPRGNGYGRGGPPPGQGGRGGGPVAPGGPAEGRWAGYPAGPAPGPVYAEPPRARAPQEYYRGEQDEAREGVRSGQIRSMGWIVSRLQSRGGRMLDANLGQGPGGQPVYRVIWASPDGRRVDYIIDARTGAILQGY